MTPIYATCDQGRVHIAYGAFYQGSVSRYGNWFTKFFAKLFCMSTDVSINSKTYSVNKNDYVKLLSSMSVPATRKTIKMFQNFNNQTFVARGDLGLMRSHLTPGKVSALGRKMIAELVNGHDAQVEKFLGKGAEINSYFWMKGTDSKIYFGQDPDTSGAYPPEKVEPVEERKYTPLLYVTGRGMDTGDYRLRDLFIQFGAHINSLGVKRTFQRDLLQTTFGEEDVPVSRSHVTYVPTVRSHLVPNHRRPGCHVQTRLGVEPVVSYRPGLDRVTTETKLFRDTYCNEQTIAYNLETGLLDMDAPKAPSVREWNKRHVTSRTSVV